MSELKSRLFQLAKEVQPGEICAACAWVMYAIMLIFVVYARMNISDTGSFTMISYTQEKFSTNRT